VRSRKNGCFTATALCYPSGEDRTPSLRFIDRGDPVSDRFGEKLSEPFVVAALREVFGREGPGLSCSLLTKVRMAAVICFTSKEQPKRPGLKTSTAGCDEFALRLLP
jgi:hypothetical protein